MDVFADRLWLMSLTHLQQVGKRCNLGSCTKQHCKKRLVLECGITEDTLYIVNLLAKNVYQFLRGLNNFFSNLAENGKLF